MLTLKRVEAAQYFVALRLPQLCTFCTLLSVNARASRLACFYAFYIKCAKGEKHSYSNNRSVIAIIMKRLYYFWLKYTIKTVTSAGFTPEIRPACPRVRGRTLESFSRASSLSP